MTTNWHPPTPPTLNEYGEDQHPAFGAITAHRITSTPGATLFDSDIRHQHIVRVTISQMTRKRDLNHDWLHPKSMPLIEVDMSEAQWASFVSSMNTTAVPCTLRSVGDDHNIDGLEHAPRLAHSMAEVHEAAEKAFEKIKAAMAELDALDPKAGVKERRAALSTLRHTIGNATSNVDFAGRQLAEHAENVVQKARADVEAMVVQKAAQVGIDAGEPGSLLALEMGADA